MLGDDLPQGSDSAVADHLRPLGIPKLLQYPPHISGAAGAHPAVVEHLIHQRARNIALVFFKRGQGLRNALGIELLGLAIGPDVGVGVGGRRGRRAGVGRGHGKPR